MQLEQALSAIGPTTWDYIRILEYSTLVTRAELSEERSSDYQGKRARSHNPVRVAG